MLYQKTITTKTEGTIF